MSTIEHIARLWPKSGKVVVLTGAGISVASGIPDFRSPGGLWSRYDPMQVASVQAIERSPKAVWRFILDAVSVMGHAKPNPAHTALARLEAAGLVEAVVTQNIDGLHQAAGSKNVVEFHGTMAAYRCHDCGLSYDAAVALTLTEETAPWLCAECGGVVRPDIVFFGESIPLDALEKSGQLAGAADMALVVGTSCEVTPANVLPQLVKQRGAKVAEINVVPSRLAHLADALVRAKAEESLPALADLLLGRAQ